MADFAGYPKCKTGDVRIVLSAEKELQLHSEILRRHCRFFARALCDSEAEGAVAAAKQKSRKSAAGVRWQFLLQADKYGNCRLMPLTGNAIGNVGPGFYSAGQSAFSVVDQYEWVLDAVYNRPVGLDTEDMVHLFTHAQGILDIAEELGCVHTVNRNLDSVLGEYPQVLWPAIHNNPFTWAEIAIRLRSFNILKVVAVHLVGKWPTLTEEEKDSVPEKLRHLSERKSRDLTEEKEAIDLELSRYYPDRMKRSDTEVASKQTRASYSNEIVGWICAGAFRQWLCQQVIQKKTYEAEDGGFDFYSRISRGGNAYLDESAMSEFRSDFAMSTRGWNGLQVALNEFKEGMRPLVAPLFKNNSHLDLSSQTVSHFVCANFARKEILDLWQDPGTLDWGPERVDKTEKRRLLPAYREPSIELISASISNHETAQVSKKRRRTCSNSSTESDVKIMRSEDACL